jgi:hypothetical protein
LVFIPLDCRLATAGNDFAVKPKVAQVAWQQIRDAHAVCDGGLGAQQVRRPNAVATTGWVYCRRPPACID